jgi:hypothetical protein
MHLIDVGSDCGFAVNLLLTASFHHNNHSLTDASTAHIITMVILDMIIADPTHSEFQGIGNPMHELMVAAILTEAGRQSYIWKLGLSSWLKPEFVSGLSTAGSRFSEPRRGAALARLLRYKKDGVLLYCLMVQASMLSPIHPLHIASAPRRCLCYTPSRWH